MTSLLLTFSLFPQLVAELRLQIWHLACCSARVVEVQYDLNKDRFVSKSRAPSVLHVSRESRHEALRIYKLYFATPSAPSHIYFNPGIDTLYVPRSREMGYDETLRDFQSYLAVPEELDSIHIIGLDYVSAKVKRPWESYNKAVWIRSFSREVQVVLVLRVKGGWQREMCDQRDGDLEFVEPDESAETLQQILADTREEFARELAGTRYVGLDDGQGGPLITILALKGTNTAQRIKPRTWAFACPFN